MTMSIDVIRITAMHADNAISRFTISSLAIRKKKNIYLSILVNVLNNIFIYLTIIIIKKCKI